ncbi:MAG: prephenate dehydrogenase [Ruminococcaceae bacterium]|nr:prephenate dehydrogenase [Oscillospiraceae bacterium]
MTVGVVGLGLIGGSMARAYKAAQHKVSGLDKDSATLGYALLSGICDNELTKDNIGECDIVFIALYPEASIKWLQENGKHISKKCFVIDLCGTKKNICEEGFRAADEYGFTFVGGHPMAGTQFSGIKYSRKDLFKGAPMVIVPPRYDDIELLDKIKTLLSPALFGSISVTTAEKHDEMIAFTSQLAHIVSNAYIKSETAKSHGGFSAGSYKDMTRVAWLNENMWTELFHENSDNLIKELRFIIDSLTEYKTALENDDKDTMRALLKDGRILKEKIDGNSQKKA